VSTLRDAERQRCPKCGGIGDVRYHGTGYRCERFGRAEHLHWLCPCGYEWATQPNDAANPGARWP